MLSDTEGDDEYRRLAIACELPISLNRRGQVNAERMYFTDGCSKGPLLSKEARGRETRPR
jgi:hypothetical protein